MAGRCWRRWKATDSLNPIAPTLPTPNTAGALPTIPALVPRRDPARCRPTSPWRTSAMSNRTTASRAGTAGAEALRWKW
ncbi:hypothetical protein M8494_22180 [Serratia ureilytica]